MAHRCPRGIEGCNCGAAYCGWRPMHTAPTDGTAFLAFDAYGEFQIARMDEGLFRSWETGKRVDLDTWQPLPNQPASARRAA